MDDIYSKEFAPLYRQWAGGVLRDHEVPSFPGDHPFARLRADSVATWDQEDDFRDATQDVRVEMELVLSNAEDPTQAGLWEMAENLRNFRKYRRLMADANRFIGRFNPGDEDLGRATGAYLDYLDTVRELRKLLLRFDPVTRCTRTTPLSDQNSRPDTDAFKYLYSLCMRFSQLTKAPVVAEHAVVELAMIGDDLSDREMSSCALIHLGDHYSSEGRCILAATAYTLAADRLCTRPGPKYVESLVRASSELTAVGALDHARDLLATAHRSARSLQPYDPMVEAMVVEEVVNLREADGQDAEAETARARLSALKSLASDDFEV